MTFDELPQAERFHADLNEGDTETSTVGCRHTKPDICKKHRMASVCAYARPDRICLAPPRSWPKQFVKLRSARGAAS